MNCNNLKWYDCSDCGRSDLVWTRDGDIVCRACGLVKEAHYISEQPEWNMYGHDDDKHSSQIRTEEYVDILIHKNKASHVFKEHLHMFDTSLISSLDDIYDLCKPLHEKHRRSKKIIFVAVCIYISAKMERRALKPDDICSLMNVHFDHNFWSVHGEVIAHIHKNRPRLFDKLHNVSTRQNKINMEISGNVHRLCDFSENAFKLVRNRHHLIRVANDIRTKAMTVASNSKSDKFDISVIYVACKALGYKISTHDFTRCFDISKSTMEKHEKMIQHALKSLHT